DLARQDNQPFAPAQGRRHLFEHACVRSAVVNESEIVCEAERWRGQSMELLPHRDRLGWWRTVGHTLSVQKSRSVASPERNCEKFIRRLRSAGLQARISAARSPEGACEKIIVVQAFRPAVSRQTCAASRRPEGLHYMRGRF